MPKNKAKNSLKKRVSTTEAEGSTATSMTTNMAETHDLQDSNRNSQQAQERCPLKSGECATQAAYKTANTDRRAAGPGR
jgi:hypothetical protein